MRAAYYTTTGPAAEVLQTGDLPDPVAGPGEVLVRIAVSGVNPTDVKTRGGVPGRRMGHDLVIPHHDGAGSVIATGPGVDPARRGQRVWLHAAQFGRAHGTAAEFVALPERLAIPLPDTLSDAEGACVGVPVLTAWNAVLADGPVAGRRVLITGGAGAVGQYAIQIARLSGARVAATVSTPEKADAARAAGAEIAVDYRNPEAAATLRDWSEGGFDHIIDVDTATNGRLLADVLAMGGRVVSYGSRANDAIQPIRDFRQRLATIRFLFVFALPWAETDRMLRAVGALLETGQLSHRVAASFPLERIAEAHAAVEHGQMIGKVLVLP